MWELNNRMNLLICQKSKIDDWVEHFREYYPEDLVVFDLTKKKEVEAFRHAEETCSEELQIIGVINYDLAFRRPYLKELPPFTLMLDESSMIQNEQAKRSKFIVKLPAESVILLSGTPVGGKYEHLWSQCHLLGWGITKERFYEHFIIQRMIEDPRSGFQFPVVVGYKNVRRLKEKLAEYGAVFMKTEEVMDLPEQQDITLNVSGNAAYRKFMKDSVVVVDGNELIGDTTLTKRLYARQLCGQYSKEKLNAFKDILEGTNDRLIVFYNFTAELNALRKITESHTTHISVMNGSEKDLSAYETYDDSVTFIQYQAGAMGLNLQKANKIIYFTLPVRSELFEQSKKRIHRIGQTRPCFYYYMVCKGTVEVDIQRTLKMRRDYTDDLFKKFDS